MSRNIREFVVAVPNLKGVSENQFKDYITDAIGSWKNGYSATSPLRPLKREDVSVVRKKSPSTHRPIPLPAVKPTAENIASGAYDKARASRLTAQVDEMAQEILDLKEQLRLAIESRDKCNSTAIAYGKRIREAEDILRGA